MATTIRVFTNGGTGSQPFGSGSGFKMIDDFSTSDLVFSPADTEANHTDPYQEIAFRKIESVYMTVGGTSGTANAARMGLWRTANIVFDYGNITLNGTAATVSSATTNTVSTINAVIADGVTYRAGTWASASLAAKRDTATGSFSSYSGNASSSTVATTYNPGNLQFGLRYYYLPNAPAAPTITSKTSNSVTIGWAAPSDPGGYAESTLRYKVKWTNASGGESIAIEETSVAATSATITGLDPGETYQFYVAAMNGVIPTGINSYISNDSSVYIDNFSSGPYSPASTATKLNGGRYDGTDWKPITYLDTKVIKLQSTAFTDGKVYPFSAEATVQVNTVNQPLDVGDVITIAGTSSPSGFNGNFAVEGVTGSSGAWVISFTQGYYNPTGSNVAATPNGTISATYYPVIKAYNGTSWITIV
jgi:hypothetical protein